jgi:steroid delta-isomerase
VGSATLDRPVPCTAVPSRREKWAESPFPEVEILEVLVADESARKAMALEYVGRINDGDVDGVLELFSEDVIFEDPVGKPPIVGKKALRKHLEFAVKCRVREKAGTSVTSMDGRYVVTPTKVTVFAPTKINFTIIGVLEVGDDGLGHRLRAFWGETDMTLGDPAKAE